MTLITYSFLYECYNSILQVKWGTKLIRAWYGPSGLNNYPSYAAHLSHNALQLGDNFLGPLGLGKAHIGWPYPR